MTDQELIKRIVDLIEILISRWSTRVDFQWRKTFGLMKVRRLHELLTEFVMKGV